MSMDEVERSMEMPGDMVPGAIIKTGKPLPKDPWIHRSERMLCKTCMYYVPKDSSIGRCRRHAPVVCMGYPVVFSADWCGDHKLDKVN